ncbi:MAG: YafY family transcriptional regulator [Gammaproteobacteria bacterium]|nr:YafY family transcriptional regulator [Gammaproteobacteria bacterium]MBU1554515.1 YafY family transcriptional regulator [Gammaproteobacteria bacterium]MBU2071974.1 YafY family transcriptional regulator [Gammaproteobacteria bacterium]MBU2183941.1 YafY family transcriptional regulator [Gammaproteobacteria bacterium]MBU2204336.1 YafY family transcriptional regulator [Gammaproteobacteria bacterium]
MNRVDRLLALILYLQSRRYCTAEMMAEHFGLSVRTIYRDLAALAEAGVPVLAETGLGYRLMKGYMLPPVNFSEQEAMALSTGLMLAQRMTSQSYLQLMQSALDKVKSVLPADAKQRLEHLARAMATPANTPPIQADLSMLQQAIARQQLVQFSYQKADLSLSERLAEPAGLLYYLGRWHFIAWCRLRNAYRDFRTDRISQLTLLTETVTSRGDFDAQNFIRQSIPQAPLRARVRFTAVAADRAKREWWQGISHEVQTAANIELTLNSSDWSSLASWLLSLGNSAQVVEPAELISEIRRQSTAILAQYA